MNKNAYEIRLDVLSMAHSDLTMIFHERLSNLKKVVDSSGDNYHEGPIDDATIRDLYPKPEDIIERARELYTFINDG